MKKILFFVLILSTMIFAQRRTSVDVGNSSTTLLDSSAVFTGVANDVVYNGRWSSVSVSVWAEHAVDGGSNTLVVRFGTDGTNWAETNTFTVTDSVEYNYVFPLRYQYYQVVFTNDTVDMSEFRLESILYESDMSVSKTLEDSIITVEISGNTGTALTVADDSTHTNTLAIETTLNGIETDVDTLADMGKDVHDANLDADRFVNLSPEWARYAYGTNSATNLDTDSLFTILDMDGYKYASFQINTSGGVTTTIFGTNESTASNADSQDGNWVDISSTVLGGASVSDVNLMYFVRTPLVMKKYMVRSVTADASNSIDIDCKKVN